MEISIREWEKSDAETLVDIVKHTNKKYLRDRGYSEYTLDNAKRYIDLATGKGIGIYRAIEYDGKVVGAISIEIGKDITAIDGHLSYFLRDSYEGNGIMTMAVKMIVKEAFRTLPIVRISAFVASPNIGSIRVLENNGFTLEGVMRNASVIENELTDVAIYSLLKEELK